MEYVVMQARLRSMEQEVPKDVDGLVPERRHRGIARRQHRRVTERATGAHEQAAPIADRGRAPRRVWRRGERRQESLKEGELLDRVQSGRCGRDLGIGDVIRESGELAVRVLLTLLL